MKKRILLIALIGMSCTATAQDETVNGKLTVKGGIEIKKYQYPANFPSQTSRGDILQLYQNVNNGLEIGVGGELNTRRSWILSRHSSVSGSYGKYYSTLHLQPDIGDKTQYRGIAIGYSANAHISVGTHLAINGKVGIGTINPSHDLEIHSSRPIISLKNSADGISSYGWLEFNDVNSRMGYVGFGSTNTNHLYITNDTGGNISIPKGNVSIGNTASTGSHKLAVEGSIGAREIKVETNGWSDFVFYDNYKLPTLIEVENYIKEKKHLKDIPSAKEVEENGIFLGEMNSKLLQKIEELTLYTIQQEKKLKKQAQKIEDLESLNEKLLELQSRLEKLESEK